jgi:hypothetical protein
MEQYREIAEEEITFEKMRIERKGWEAEREKEWKMDVKRKNKCI